LDNAGIKEAAPPAPATLIGIGVRDGFGEELPAPVGLAKGIGSPIALLALAIGDKEGLGVGACIAVRAVGLGTGVGSDLA
jgi:hypothetical protein